MAVRKKPVTLGDLFQKISEINVTQLLYGLLLVAVFLLGYFFARVQALEGKGGTKAAAPSQILPQGQEQQPSNEKVDVAIGKGQVRGKENAKVTIVEFTDFECPFCERFFKETLPEIEKNYINSGKVKFYLRQFPLDFHVAAMPSAIAAYCANDQGKMWEFHDKVFTEQQKISAKTPEAINTQLKAWAAELGLNAGRFNSCLDNETYKDLVNQDLDDGKNAGVSGTPTVFVNGRRIVGAQPYESFKAAIEEELKK